MSSARASAHVVPVNSLIRAAPQKARRIDAVHRTLFGREAELDEIALGKKYLSLPDTTSTDNSLPQLTRWQEYLQTLLLSNEFVFVD